MMRTTTQAQHIVEKFGGLSALARHLGHRHPTTVQRWLESGYIPTKRYDEIMRAAEAAGVDLRREDFVLHLDPPTAAE